MCTSIGYPKRKVVVVVMVVTEYHLQSSNVAASITETSVNSEHNSVTTLSATALLVVVFALLNAIPIEKNATNKKDFNFILINLSKMPTLNVFRRPRLFKVYKYHTLQNSLVYVYQEFYLYLHQYSN